MHLTKRHYLISGGAILLAAALTVSAAALRDTSDPVTLPEHTAIHVTLDQALATDHRRYRRQDGNPSGCPHGRAGGGRAAIREVEGPGTIAVGARDRGGERTDL
jgi:hypothetical protein